MTKDSNPTKAQVEKALAARDIAGLSRMLDAGLDANWQDAQGDTLLHHAARFGDAAFVAKLAAKGAHFNVFNKQDETPRDVAIAWGHDTLASVMKEEMTAEQAPAAIAYTSLQDIRDASAKNGASEFYRLAAHGQFAAVVALAEKDPNGFTAADLLSKGANGDTAALKLAQLGQLDLLMKTPLWLDRPDDFQKVWEAVPQSYRNQGDIAAFSRDLRQAKLQSYAKPKLQGLKRGPQLPPGPKNG